MKDTLPVKIHDLALKEQLAERSEYKLHLSAVQVFSKQTLMKS